MVVGRLRRSGIVTFLEGHARSTNPNINYIFFFMVQAASSFSAKFPIFLSSPPHPNTTTELKYITTNKFYFWHLLIYQKLKLYVSCNSSFGGLNTSLRNLNETANSFCTVLLEHYQLFPFFTIYD